jgi:hypothetical protein
VGTKIDLLGEPGAAENVRRREEKDRLAALFADFPFILLSDRSSAKLLNVDNVFYHGELAVTFPIPPLYEFKTATYTPECKRALSRIFRVVDGDRDGFLSDHELNVLEAKCFKDSLRDQEIEVIKRRIFQSVSNSIDGGKMTLEGFFGLIFMFIDRYSI